MVCATATAGHIRRGGIGKACIGVLILVAASACGHSGQGEGGRNAGYLDMEDIDHGQENLYGQGENDVGRGYDTSLPYETQTGCSDCSRGCGGSGLARHDDMGRRRAMMGRGMMGAGTMKQYALGPIMRLDLSEDQRRQINKIADDLRRRDWATMGQIMDQQSKLRDLSATAKPDPNQVGDTYSSIANLHRDMVVAQVKAHNDAIAVLTDEQRQQLRCYQYGSCSGDNQQGRGQKQDSTPPPSTPPSSPAPTSPAPR